MNAIDGKSPLTAKEWSLLRSKFKCPYGVTNCWELPAVRGGERLKARGVTVHLNQKPLQLIEMTLNASADAGDVVWEPFGGLCPAAVASMKLSLSCYSSESDVFIFRAAARRLTTAGQQTKESTGSETDDVCGGEYMDDCAVCGNGEGEISCETAQCKATCHRCEPTQRENREKKSLKR
jgi:hypothetical protein